MRRHSGDRTLERAIVETLAEGVYVTRVRDGILVFANPQIEEMLGYAEGELKGQDGTRLEAGESPVEADELNRALRRQGAWHGDVRKRRKDGTVLWCRCRVTAFDHPDHGEVRIWAHAATTHPIKSEDEGQEDQTSLRRRALEHVFETVPVGLCFLDRDLRYVHINPWLAQMNGKPISDHIGRTVSEVIPEISPALEPLLKRVIESGEPTFNRDHRSVVPGEGVERDWLRSYVPMKSPDGQVAGVTVMVQDITERKTAERAAKETADELHRIVTSVPDYLWSAEIDSQGRSLHRYYSPVVESITGRPPEFYQPGPEKWLSTVHPEDKPGLGPVVERIMAGETEREEREYRVIRPDGTVRWVRDRVVVRALANGNFRLDGVVSDVTERKLLEVKLAETNVELERRVGERTAELEAEVREHRQTTAALKESEEKLRTLARLSPVGIYQADPEKGCFYANERCAEILGIPMEEILGEGWMEALHPDDRERVKEDRRQMLRHGTSSKSEYRFLRPDGRTIWVLGQRSPHFDGEGNLVSHVGTITDISERKLAEEQLLEAHEELKSTQAQLVQAGKLSAMGQLGAGIAHELNQPLSAIQMFAEMLHEDCADAPPQELDLILKQTRRMGRIIDNIRAFARNSEADFEPLNALRSLDDALMLISQQLRLAGIEVVRDPEPGLPLIRADKIELEQVFLNLINNARQALEELPQEAAKRLTLSVRSAGGFVEYTIEDTGAGVPEEIETQIFDPFFTTKASGQGTGLGLSLSYGIVRKHEGELRYERGKGGGARFVVAIPVAAARDRADPQVRAKTENVELGKTGRILVVDDEKIVQLSIAAVLWRLGCEVVTASAAEEGLEHLEQNEFDAVLLDLKMPGMSGFELCQRIKARWPALPVIAMSGYMTDDDRRRLVELGVVEVLSKPLSTESLRGAIARTSDWNAKNEVKQERPKAALPPASEVVPPLDSEIVENLREVGVFAKTAELLLSQMPERLDTIRVALAAGDAENLEDVIHSLAGSVGALGALGLMRIFREMLDLLRESRLDECALRLRSAEKEYDRVEIELRKGLLRDSGHVGSRSSVS